jgi:hypothetical protein
LVPTLNQKKLVHTLPIISLWYILIQSSHLQQDLASTLFSLSVKWFCVIWAIIRFYSELLGFWAFPIFRYSSVFYFLECRTMDKVQMPSNSECYTPLSELFRIYQLVQLESYVITMLDMLVASFLLVICLSSFFYLHSGGWSPHWVHSARRPLTGLSYLPRVIVRMENLVEWMAGETEVLGENLHRHHLVHHKSHLTRPGIEPGPPRWEASD